MSGGSKSVIVGYRYYLGAHLALCHGEIDNILKIRVNKRDAWVLDSPSSGDNIYVNNPNLFGGDGREGGVQGNVNVINGSPTEAVNVYLQSKIGGNIPAFRGIASIVLNQVYIGLNPYLKNWAITCKRIGLNSSGVEQWNKPLAPVGWDYSSNQAIYIALDRSVSMEGVKLSSMKTAVNALLDYIFNLIDFSNNAYSVNIMLSAFSDGSQTIERNSIDAIAISELQNWVSSLIADDDGGTDFDAGVASLSDFMAAQSSGTKKTLIFITDGIDSGESLTNAVNIVNSVNGLYSYAYNIDTTDTTATDLIDNTGGAVVVNSADHDAMLREFRASIADQSKDMNPAHIIRECLTDKVWGMGYNDSDIDDVSFEAAAETLFNENFGLSILWSKETSIYEFVKNILSHIDATLYVSRGTGKFVLTLARNDYDINTLLELNEDNIQSITNFKRKSISELVNQVTIIFEDNNTNEQGSVTESNLALVQEQGIIISETFNFSGISNPILARRVAARELRSLSSPLMSCTIYASRVAYDLNVGDVFKLNWPNYGIASVVMRVTSIELGDLNNSLIKIDCVQDVFGVAQTLYTSYSGTEWVEPSNPPIDMPYPYVVEMPYYLIAKSIGDDDAQALPVGAGYILATGGSPSDDSFSFEIYNNPTSWTQAGRGEFCPTATLAAEADYLTTEILLNSGVDLDIIETSQIAVIGTEIVYVESSTLTSDGYVVTIKRGCLDTVRQEHPINTRVFFISDNFGDDGVEYVDGETASVRLLPITGQGTLPVESATTQSVVMDSRKDRPYPPAKVRVNGLEYPDTIFAATQWEVTWAHRDRLQQTATVIDDNQDSVGPEAGTTYVCELYDSTNTLIHAHASTNGDTVTFSIGNLGSNYGNLTIKLWSERDGLQSWQIHQITITRLEP